MRHLATLLALVCALSTVEALGQPPEGQAQLLVAFDFEGDSGSIATEKSGFGTQLDALLGPNASLVNDAERGGTVLKTGMAIGWGASTLHDLKLEVTQSYTLSGWLKTNSNGAWEHFIGRPGVGPRILNHWGYGGQGITQFIVPDQVGVTDVHLNFGPGNAVEGVPGGDGEWHHMLVSWNHVTREYWGYHDGETGELSDDNGLATDRTLVVTHEGPPGLAFSMGTDPNNVSFRLEDSLIDDVAFWQGYATQEVAQGLFDGTYTIFDAPIIFPESTPLTADTEPDGDVDGADFLNLQRDDPDLISPAWTNQYGTGGGSLVSLAAVPEPASPVMLLLGMAALGWSRRRY